MSEQAMFCGIGKIPKGKVRGTPEYCVQARQVRYYGLKVIDEKFLHTKRRHSLIKEQLKLKRIEDNAKMLIREVRNLKLILEDEGAKPSLQKKAQKKFNKLLLERDKLVKQLKQQKKIVDEIEKQEKKRSAKK
jgi:hypothetical protein